MKNNFQKPAVLFLTVALTAGSVMACGGGSTSSTKNAVFYNNYDTAAPMEKAAGGMMDGGYYAEEGNYDIVAETAAAAMSVSENSMVEEISTASGQTTNSSEAAKLITMQRKLIRTVSLNVETTDFDNLLSAIQQSVTTDGGYIEQSDVSGTSISTAMDRNRYAFLNVRIPSAKLDAFLSQMSQQSNVINRSENIQDVTLQYTDIESRKKSLTIEQERLWALLEKADTLEAVIALEERLSEIRYQLEGFESQLRTYDNQVDYSTVHINIQEVSVFTPTSPDSVGIRIQKGFIRNLENVSNALTDLLVWVISHLPALVLLAIVLMIIRAIVKKSIQAKKTSESNPSKKAKQPKKHFSNPIAKSFKYQTGESASTPNTDAVPSNTRSASEEKESSEKNSSV